MEKGHAKVMRVIKIQDMVDDSDGNMVAMMLKFERGCDKVKMVINRKSRCGG